jgi:hypothetical protein
MFTYFINSLFIFLTTYILAYLIYQFSTALVASSYNIGSIISFKELKFTIDNTSSLWFPKNVVVPSVTFIGPLICLFIGLIILGFLRIKRSNFKPVTLLFLLWLAYHCFSRFFAGFIGACIELDEIWIGYTYLNLDDVFYFIFWALSLLSLSITGFVFFDIFLLTSGSATIKNQAGGVYLTYGGVLPWIIGSLIIYLFHLPEIFAFEIWILLFMGLIPLSQNIGRWMFQNKGINLKLHKGNESFAWLWLLICTLIIILFRLNIIEKIPL